MLLVGSGPLADAIAERLEGMPVVRHTDPFPEVGSFDLLLDVDLVIDAGLDDTARYLVNDAAAIRGIPMVWVDDHDGTSELGTVWDELDVDYRDLRPVPGDRPAPGLGGEPATLGRIADTVAARATSVLAGDASSVGTVTWFRASGESTAGFSRDPDAPRPGSLEERTALREPDPDRSVTPATLQRLLAGPRTAGIHESPPLLLDVREAPEASFVSLPDSLLIPLGQLPDRLDEVAEKAGGRDASIVVYCHHGVRSARALELLEKAGFTRARHLTGGIDAWRVQVEPEMPAY